MYFTDVIKLEFDFSAVALWRLFIVISFLFLFAPPIAAQVALSQPDKNTLIINDAPEMEVFAFGRTVIVRNRAKGVLSFGGDVIIEGEVSGDVAIIGGSVIQKKDSFIGGDVIIFGGQYLPEANPPKRNKGKETVMYAGYEEELRSLMKQPSQILSPTFSWGFIVQRLLSVLFWFIVSLALTTITPGAISRGIARFRLSRLKVFGIGALGFLLTSLILALSLEFLAGFISVIVGLMAFALVMLSYVFGRVILQASVGKWVAKKIFSRDKQSETVALLIGALIWTVLLSIPYIWMLALFILFIASLGLILTARSKERWQKT